jgi:nucleoside-diphosphate-sugar epimerase
MKDYILVTGANGFLGSEIVSQLVKSGLLVRSTGIEDEPSKSNIDYIKADITQFDQIKYVLKGNSTVIHAAGLAHIFSPDINSAERLHRVNEIGTENIASAAAAAGVKHLILISSVSVYGKYTKGAYDEKTPCNPVGPYALSKHKAELRAVEIAQQSRMALTILRLATLYGEDDPGNIGRLIRMLDNGYFVWVGDGSNRKSLLYKNDAARACLVVAQHPASGVNIFNVSSPPYTMREIVDGIKEALDKRTLNLKIPASLALFISRRLPGKPNSRIANLHETLEKWLAEDVYNTDLFERTYGFRTETLLKDGLKREVNWYRQKQQRKL